MGMLLGICEGISMTQRLTTTREERGQTIAQSERASKKNRRNASTSLNLNPDNGEYTVNKVNGEWLCDCPDNKYRHVECKHIHAVNFSQSLRAEVAVRTIVPIENISECIFCGSSNFIKKGIRKNKTGNLQKFYCQDCHKFFTFNLGFERMKHNPQAITSAMQLYFSGESLRNTMRSLKLLGVEVSYRTILNWIKKYIKLMNDYVETIEPNVGDTWRADELWIKVKGNMKYLFAMMDDETRFWIAQEVADTKDKHDARTLFCKSKLPHGKET